MIQPGQRIGHATVEEFAGFKGSHGRWWVLCDCGWHGKRRASDLKAGYAGHRYCSFPNNDTPWFQRLAEHNQQETEPSDGISPVGLT